jgi:hypothetical protein
MKILKFCLVGILIALVAVGAVTKNASANNRIEIPDSSLSDEERASIRAYTDKVSIRDGIGQIFMVGLTGDHLQGVNNYDREALTEIGVGGVIFNGGTAISHRRGTCPSGSPFLLGRDAY